MPASNPCMHLLVVWQVLLLGACKPPLCIKEARPGTRYRLSLHSPYDPQADGNPATLPVSSVDVSCGGQDGLGVGTVLMLTLDTETAESFEPVACRVPYGELDPTLRLSEVEERRRDQVASAYAFTIVTLTATLPDGCRGFWRLVPIVNKATDPFSAAEPGRSPAIIVQREFWPDRTDDRCLPRDPETGELRPLCSDAWAARLEPL
jgi:hypothetical protein